MAAASLQARIAELARKKATAVSLRDLFRYGRRPSPSVRLQNALFLQQELPIRMAQRIAELETLPFGLHSSEPIRRVIDWYSSYVETLTAMPKLASSDHEQEFTAALESMMQTPSLVVVMLSSAAQELQAYEQPRGSPASATRHQQLLYMQSVLDRFFTARIGLRFLMEQHIYSNVAQDDDWSGVIQANFNPARVIEAAGEDASQLCRDEYGAAPEVIIRMADIEDAPSMKRNNRLTYVPSHMHYIMCELLKNAMRATIIRHGEAGDIPPVVVTAAFGKDTLGVRVSDEGGGISLSKLSQVSMYVCMCVCMYVCMYVCMCVCM